MRLTSNDRAALSQAILAHVNGCLDIEKTCPHAEVFGEWAHRVRAGSETAAQYAALRHLHSLPYTHPVIDDENTPEDDSRAAAFLLAVAKVNGGSYPNRSTARTADVIKDVLSYLS